MKIALAALAVVALAACKGKDGDYSGIGHWRFGVTTLKDAASAGKCGGIKLADGRDATWCLGLQQMKIGKTFADVDLYFLGDKADAPLIEVQLKIRGCEEDDVDRFMRKLFGDPFETKQGPWREYWKNSFMWMLAQLPDAPAHCLVHFLPIEEKSEIDRLSKLPETKPPDAPPATPAAPPVDAATAAAPAPDAATPREAARESSATARANALVGAADDHGESRRRTEAELAAQIEAVKESGKQVSIGRRDDTGGPPAAPTSPTGRIVIVAQRSDGGGDVAAVTRKIQMAYTAGIKRCYTSYLKRDPSARGRLVLSFTVTETGRVRDASVKGFADEIDQCVRALTSSWRFAIPKDKDGEAIAAAFTFELQLIPE